MAQSGEIFHGWPPKCSGRLALDLFDRTRLNGLSIQDGATEFGRLSGSIKGRLSYINHKYSGSITGR